MDVLAVPSTLPGGLRSSPFRLQPDPKVFAEEARLAGVPEAEIVDRYFTFERERWLPEMRSVWAEEVKATYGEVDEDRIDAMFLDFMEGRPLVAPDDQDGWLVREVKDLADGALTSAGRLVADGVAGLGMVALDNVVGRWLGSKFDWAGVDPDEETALYQRMALVQQLREQFGVADDPRSRASGVGSFLGEAATNTGASAGMIVGGPIALTAGLAMFGGTGATSAGDDLDRFTARRRDLERAMGLATTELPGGTQRAANRMVAGGIEAGAEFLDTVLTRGIFGLGSLGKAASRKAAQAVLGDVAKGLAKESAEELVAATAKQGAKAAPGLIASAWSKLTAAAAAEGVSGMATRAIRSGVTEGAEEAVTAAVQGASKLAQGYDPTYTLSDVLSETGRAAVVGGAQAVVGAPVFEFLRSRAVRRATREMEAELRPALDDAAAMDEVSAEEALVERDRQTVLTADGPDALRADLAAMLAGDSTQTAVAVDRASFIRDVGPEERELMERHAIDVRWDPRTDVAYLFPATDGAAAAAVESAIKDGDGARLLGYAGSDSLGDEITGGVVFRDNLGRPIRVWPTTEANRRDVLAAAGLYARATGLEAAPADRAGFDAARKGAALVARSGRGARRPQPVEDRPVDPLRTARAERNVLTRLRTRAEGMLRARQSRTGEAVEGVVVERVADDLLPNSQRAMVERWRGLGKDVVVLTGKANVRSATGKSREIDLPLDGWFDPETPNTLYLATDRNGRFTGRSMMATLWHEAMHALQRGEPGARRYARQLAAVDPATSLRAASQYLEQGGSAPELLIGTPAPRPAAVETPGRAPRRAPARIAGTADTYAVEGAPTLASIVRPPAAVNPAAARRRPDAATRLAAIEEVPQATTQALESATVRRAVEAVSATPAERQARRMWSRFVDHVAYRLTRLGFRGRIAQQLLAEIEQRARGVADAELELVRVVADRAAARAAATEETVRAASEAARSFTTAAVPRQRAIPLAEGPTSSPDLPIAPESAAGPTSATESIPLANPGTSTVDEYPVADEQTDAPTEATDGSDGGAGADAGDRAADAGGPRSTRLGRATALRLASGGVLEARYAAIEADELIPSHDARRNFARNPDGDLNERPYDDPVEGRASRETVERIASNPDPELLTTDTPTPVDGPPVVSPSGVVYGGNARTMAVQLAYSRDGAQADRLREGMQAAAAKFGLSVEGLAQPLIVRVVGDTYAPGELSRILNESLTTGKSTATEAVSRANKLTSRTAATIGRLLNPANGESPSLREVLADPDAAATMVRAFVADGVWSEQDLPRFTEGRSFRLNDEGKLVIERTLLATIIDDPSVLSRTTPSVRRALMGALPDLLRAIQADGGRGERVRTVLRTAAEAFGPWKSSGDTLLDHFRDQQSMTPPPGFGDGAVMAVVGALDALSPRQFRGRSADLVDLLGLDRSDGPMLGFDGGIQLEPLDADESLRRAFRLEDERPSPAPEQPPPPGGTSPQLPDPPLSPRPLAPTPTDDAGSTVETPTPELPQRPVDVGSQLLADEMQQQSGADDDAPLPRGEPIDGLASIRRFLFQNAAGLRDAIEQDRVKWRGAHVWIERTVVDSFAELRRMQSALERTIGKTLPDAFNPYLQQRLLRGRLGALQKELERQYMERLQALPDLGLSAEMLSNYLYARHAPERNAYIAKINPGLTDGSGMSDVEASAIMASFASKGLLPRLEAEAARWDAYLRQHLEMRRQTGLTPEDVYQRLVHTYKHYVPLRGLASDHTEDESDPMREGYRLGRGMPKALGRTSKAQNILAQIASVHEDTLRRVERNKVWNHMLRLSRAYLDDEGIVSIVRPTRRVVVNGKVQEQLDPMWKDNPNHVGVFTDRAFVHDGHQYAKGDLVIMRLDSRALAAAIRDVPDPNVFMRVLGVINSVRRFVNTGPGNPPFAIVNAVRDFGHANLRNYAIYGGRVALEADRRYLPSFWNVLTDSAKDRRPSGWYGKFVAAGGETLHWRESGLKERSRDFEKMQRAIAGGSWETAKAALRTAWNHYESVFRAAELANRVALFATLSERGWTPAQAALAAREVTVDFGLMGDAGFVLNTLYLYSNAAIQGMRSVHQATQTTRGKITLPGLVAAGFLSAVLARALGGDDEETGMARWDLLRGNEKATNLYLPALNGSMVSIPMPFGFNLPFYIGTTMHDVWSGELDPGEAMASVFVATMDFVNALGGSNVGQNPVSALAPSELRPLVELAMNADYAGRPISPGASPFESTPLPRSQEMFDGTSQWSADFAQWLNEATGGNDIDAGFLDFSPNQIEYVIGYYLGGFGRFVKRSIDFAGGAQPRTAGNAPIVGRFIEDGSRDDRRVHERYRGIRDGVVRVERALKHPDPAFIDRYLDDNQDAVALFEMVRDAERLLRDMKQVQRSTDDQGIKAELQAGAALVRAEVVRAAREVERLGAATD
jgi:hypothetical protein